MSTIKIHSSEVWKRIESLMAAKGHSAKKLAEIAGVVPSAVAKWKHGGEIGADKLLRIGNHFGKSVDYLLGKDEAPDSAWASQPFRQQLLVCQMKTSDTEICAALQISEQTLDDLLHRRNGNPEEQERILVLMKKLRIIPMNLEPAIPQDLPGIFRQISRLYASLAEKTSERMA